MTKRRPSVRKSQAVIDFIIDKVEDGMTVNECCRRYPDKTPDAKTFYRWEAADDELYEQMNRAYGTWLMVKVDELERISTTDSTELYPHIEDFRERSEARRCRIDTLKFSLGKMAPILSKRFNTKQVVEHSGEVSSIHIVDYGKKD